jgi:hypothetical protein
MGKLDGVFPVILPRFPCFARNGSLLFAIGNIAKNPHECCITRRCSIILVNISPVFPVFFPVMKKIRVRDRFDCDWLRHHAVLRKQRFPG